MAPEPSSVSPQVSVASLQPGDAVTLPLLDAYRVFLVLRNEPEGGQRALRLQGDEGERDVRLRGGDIAVRHEHLRRRDLAHAPPPPPPPADTVVLGPPPAMQRLDHPYLGTICFQGISIYVENPIGTTRSGVDVNGKPWSVIMTAHYGEIPATVAADGDPLDVFVGPDPNADTAYVIQTKIPGTKTFDEVKVMLGYTSRSAAVRAFYAHYTKPGFMAGITEWPMREFHRALASPRVLRGKMDSGSADRATQ